MVGMDEYSNSLVLFEQSDLDAPMILAADIQNTYSYNFQQQMGTCLRPESNSQTVHISLITKIYEEVEKVISRQSFSKNGDFYFELLQPSMNRKGTVKKLTEHLQSHKDRITHCSHYILTGEFRQNTDQLPYWCTILLILDELVRDINVLTQEQELERQELERKESLDFTKSMKLSKPNKHKKLHAFGKDPLVSVRSQTICLSFQRAVSNLFNEFMGTDLSKDLATSCMTSLRKFSSHEVFKFDKATLDRHLKLLLNLSSPKSQNSHVLDFLFLANVRNFLLRCDEEADPEIHCQVLNRTIEIRTNQKELLQKNEKATSLSKEIFSIYEVFLKTPHYRSLYKVPLQQLNTHLLHHSSLYQFQYNNIILYVLMNCLLVHSNAEAEELNDLDNFNISSFIKIKDYKNLCSTANRGLVFQELIRYMQYGFKTNLDRFIIPFRKLCMCTISNVCIAGVDVRAWIPSLRTLFQEIGISLLNFVKELVRCIHENTDHLSDARLSESLTIVEILLKGERVMEGQLPTTSELISGCHLRVHDSFAINLQISCVYKALAGLKLSQGQDQFGREKYLPVFRFITDCLSVSSFQVQSCEDVYGTILNFLKICCSLESECSIRLHYLLVVLDKAMWIYNEGDLHSQFKFIYLSLVVGLARMFRLEPVERYFANYNDISEDLQFIYSVQSPNNYKDIATKLKEFKYKPLEFELKQLVKPLPNFNMAEFNRAKMMLSGHQSTKPEEESDEFVEARPRKASAIFTENASFTNEHSFATLLQSIKKV